MNTPENKMSDEEKIFGALCTNLRQQLDHVAKNYNTNNKNEVWCLQQLNSIDANINADANLPLKDKLGNMEVTLKSIMNSPTYKELLSQEQLKNNNIIRNFISTAQGTYDINNDLQIDIIVKETEIAAKKSASTRSEPNLRARAGAARNQDPPKPIISNNSKSNSATELRTKEAAQWKARKSPAASSSPALGSHRRKSPAAKAEPEDRKELPSPPQRRPR